MDNYLVKIHNSIYGEHVLSTFNDIHEAEQFAAYAKQKENIEVIVRKRFLHIHNHDLKNDIVIELNY